MDHLGDWKRTQNNGELRSEHIDQEVCLMGWVHNRRDHGGVIFVDLRDRYGLTQIVFNPEHNPQTHEQAHNVRSEWVLAVKGKVRARGEGLENPRLDTGAVEVMVDELKVLNQSQPIPFPLDDFAEVGEMQRLKWRFLDIRRAQMQQNLELRHRIYQATREYFTREKFMEIETPILTKSTPEGARDFLVPSRLMPGKFYALPQSPQLFKQLLMVGGCERYFQIVKCFRDEDLRADRQPEFTQIDVEMSFVSLDTMCTTMERMVAHVFKQVLGFDVPLPVERLDYDEVMNRFGVDAPDMRYGLELMDMTETAKTSGFKVFADAANGGGIVKAINVKGGAEKLSRKQIDDYTEYVKVFKAKGLAYIKIAGEDRDKWQGPAVKFLTDDEVAFIKQNLGAEPGDILFFGADKSEIVFAALGNLRKRLAEQLDLIPKGVFRFVWVLNFPSFEWSPEEKRWLAMHHPFTSPREQDIPLLDTDPGKVYANAYDIVLNGSEIAGGSIRIHQQDVQSKVFRALGIGEEEAREKFGFLLDALSFGAPPHGGIAFGLDRLAMIMAGESSIRDVIAFPKTQSGSDMMCDAPSDVSQVQLNELHIRKIVPEKG